MNLDLNRPLMSLTGLGLLAGILLLQSMHFLFGFSDNIFKLFSLICLSGAAVLIIVCFRIAVSLKLKASQVEKGQLDGVLKKTQAMVNATKRIKNDQQSLLQLLNAMEDCCWILDSSGKFVFANASLGELLNTKPSELVKMNHAQLSDSDFLSIFKNANDQCLSKGSEVKQDIKLEDQSYYQLSCSPIVSDDQILRGLIGILKNTTAQKQVQTLEEQFKLTDQLTNLGNRQLAVHWLKDAIGSSSDDSETAVLLLDMDNFELVNRDFGYSQGDLVLKEVGRRLAGFISDTCMPVRMSGNQFALLINQVHNPKEILDLAQAIQAALEQPVTLGNTNIKGNFSIGMARYPEHGNQAEELLLQAETDMRATRRNQPAN